LGAGGEGNGEEENGIGEGEAEAEAEAEVDKTVGLVNPAEVGEGSEAGDIWDEEEVDREDKVEERRGEDAGRGGVRCRLGEVGERRAVDDTDGGMG